MKWSKEQTEKVTKEIIELTKEKITSGELYRKMSDKVSKVQICVILRENNIIVPEEIINDLNNEYWIPIIGFEQTHKISNLGRVKTVARNREKLVRTRINAHGTVVIEMQYNKVKKGTSVAFLMATHFVKNDNNFKYVGHIDGNPYNNSIYNLAWKKSPVVYLFKQTKEEKRAKDKIRFENNKEEYKKRAKISREKLTEYGLTKSKIKRLEREYGLSAEQYLNMIEKQRNLCAICGQAEIIKDKTSGNPQSLAVDHCHNTGKVRQLLCYMCNVSLGGFKDDIDLLKRALKYLQKHK